MLLAHCYIDPLYSIEIAQNSMTHRLLALLLIASVIDCSKVKPRHSIVDSVRTVSTSCGTLQPHNFAPETIFLCKDTNSTLLHHSLLDTATRASAGKTPTDHDVRLHDLGVEVHADTWIEASHGSYYVNVEPMVPLSGCLDNDHGQGGALMGEFAVTLGATATLDLPFLWEWGIQPSPIGDVSNEITSSFTFARQFLCSIPANSTGQVFYRPFRIEVAKPRIRSWTVVRGRRPKIAHGNWIGLKKASFYSAATPPQFLCVTDPDELKC